MNVMLLDLCGCGMHACCVRALQAGPEICVCMCAHLCSCHVGRTLIFACVRMCCVRAKVGRALPTSACALVMIEHMLAVFKGAPPDVKPDR